MFDRHPVIAWAGAVITALGFTASAAGVWWYVQDTRERSIEELTRLNSIQSEQVNIRKELALQTADLEEIRKAQGTIMATIDRRLDKVEDGHDRIISESNAGQRALAVELGRVSERGRQ